MEPPVTLKVSPAVRLAAWGAFYASAGIAAVVLIKGLASAVVLSALNAMVFFHAGISTWRNMRATRSWRWLGAGFFLFSLTQLYPAVSTLATGRLPGFPGWPDAGALVSLALVGAGLVYWPAAESSPNARLRMGLDAGGAGLAVLFLSWAAALQDLSRASAVAPLAKVATMLFLVFNAAVLALVFLVGGPRPRGALAWIGSGVALSILQVLLQVPLGLNGTYTVGHSVDLLIIFSGICMLAAASLPFPEETPAPGPAATDPRWTLLVPILPVALCQTVFLGIALFAPYHLDPVLQLLSVPLVGLVLWREFLALRDFQSLSGELEIRVQERSRALESAQALLLRTERMNTLASLGAGLAHDLKNLVGVVKNYALLMEMDLKEGRPADPKDLEALRLGADQAAELAHQLMSFGHENESAMYLFDLNDTLRPLISLLRATLPARISLRFTPSSHPLPLNGDPLRVEQAVVNLILNARDAIPGPGIIGIELDLERAPGLPPAACLKVWDNGAGMAPEVLAKAFEPFYTTKALASGKGLGLASVRDIVDQFEGRIGVESREGEGTRFLIHLPLAGG